MENASEVFIMFKGAMSIVAVYVVGYRALSGQRKGSA